MGVQFGILILVARPLPDINIVALLILVFLSGDIGLRTNDLYLMPELFSFSAFK
jgi:hypothetical protein